MWENIQCEKPLPPDGGIDESLYELYLESNCADYEIKKIWDYCMKLQRIDTTSGESYYAISTPEIFGLTLNKRGQFSNFVYMFNNSAFEAFPMKIVHAIIKDIIYSLKALNRIPEYRV
jgi:hypothetical protein